MKKTKSKIIISSKELFFNKRLRIGSNFNTSFEVSVYKENDIHYVDIGLGPAVDGDHNYVFTMSFPERTDLKKMANLLNETAEIISKNKLDRS